MRDPGRRTLRAAFVCALLALAMSAAIGARPAAAENPGPAAGDGKVVLHIGWMGEVDSMNPLIGWTNNVYEIYGNEYLLIVLGSWETYEPGDKGIAKSWEVSDDDLVWTFRMNEGMTWHDGEPITADDPVFTFNFIIDNKIDAYINFLRGVERAEVVDELTFRVVCSRPVANLTRVWIPCLPEHVWGKMGAKEATRSFQNDPPIVGSGPFQVVEWKRNDYLRMKAYKDFYLGAPTVDEVIFVVYLNGDTMVQDLLSGDIDAAYMFPPAQFERLRATEGIEAIEYNYYNWDYVGFNCYDGPSGGHPALRDREFRVALEYAVDRGKILENAYGGHGWIGYTFLPPDTWKTPDYAWAPDESQARTYDPERAKRILDEAGYRDTNGDGVREYKGKPIKLRLWADTASAQAQRACKLIAGWWKAVGVDVALTVQDTGVFFDRIWDYKDGVFHPDFDAYYWDWDGYADPGQTLTCFTTGQIEGWNEFAWANDEFSRLDMLQAGEMDQDRRAEYIHRMQEVMYEDCPCLTTVFPFKLQAYRTDTWEGWMPRAGYGHGPVFMTAEYPWAYYSLTPKEAGGEASSLGMWVAIVSAIAGVVAVVAWLVVRRRRRGPAEEA